MKPVPPAIKILSGTPIVLGSDRLHRRPLYGCAESEAVHRAGQPNRAEDITQFLFCGHADPDVVVREARIEVRLVASLKQDGDCLSHMPMVEVQALDPRQGAELFAAGLHGFRRNRTGEFHSGSSSTRGIAEYMEVR